MTAKLAGARADGSQTGGRSIAVAIVGTFASGKTTLLEAMLARTNAIPRQGKVSDGNTLGDGGAEARQHGISVEVNIAECDYLGDRLSFIDCPGSVEFVSEADGALGAVDLAIVVAEPEQRKIPALQLALKKLDELSVPRMMFLNKIDKADIGVRDALKLLATATPVPLVLRQIPIRDGDRINGFVDLALQRAHIYREHAPSTVVEIPDDAKARQMEARYSMLETLSNHDDDLLEKLLEDIEPETEHVFSDLADEARQGLICPVFIGSAEFGHGVGRLLKAIRHEAQSIEATCARLGLPAEGAQSDDASPLLRVIKTLHTAHAGKLSVARLLRGNIAENTMVASSTKDFQRPSGLYALMGQQATKRTTASAGDVVALGKLDDIATGDMLFTDGAPPADVHLLPPPPAPVLSLAIVPAERRDEVKLSAALAKLIEEDPSLVTSQIQDTAETLLKGQGEMHLRVALERLENKYGLRINTATPEIPYRETIRGSCNVRGRHKKQSGGHGQFGDVVIDIGPLPRGAGFEFSDTITGGVVPKQYIPSVAAGVREALQRGPLGFPVVDISVTLADGSYHSVDSSDQAFRMAGILAIREGLDKCKPILLEPIYKVMIACPNDTTSKINAIVSGRRGQLLGFGARDGWEGWDEVQALMPEAEIGDLIIELRSATFGVAHYTRQFDHMAELTGRAAELVMSNQAKTRAA